MPIKTAELFGWSTETTKYGGRNRDGITGHPMLQSQWLIVAPSLLRQWCISDTFVEAASNRRLLIAMVASSLRPLAAVAAAKW